ncbi:glycosyltransferase [Mixta intestinalis]|jgi:glycosyltransferase involved in cell wall biosynthesis|uniref:Alpha-maltose-1-phosphate synthase n=1 Tax=Mixta intestinalis TaxID=1615494 RepID=A0A6P1PZZ4_9GAMM|nr:glycosyltransferase [Mixta intestinalis]QHM71594.1 Alpha-maltose-1-phosphate synthase [Mixta intestinalis]
MKILHAAETIKGGVATVLKQLVAAQQDDRETYRIQCLIPADQAGELDTAHEENVVKWERKGRSVGALISFATAFCRAVILFKPDVVHLHSSFAGVIGRACLILLWPIVRPKVVYCPHAFSFLMQTSGGKKKIYALIEKALLPMTDAIICVSQYEADQARAHGIKGDKLFVIHNGVPQRHIIRPDKTDDTRINMLFVGRFDYQKGYDILLDAMKRNQNPNIHLTLIGDSVHSAEHIEKLPQAEYTGWLKASQMEPYFIAADVLVIPSRWEGFAMVPLEAMSYSLPIIASDATSLPEVVINNETGYLFKNGDADSLLSVFNRLEKSDLSKMGKKGNQLYTENFTSQAMITKTHSLYADIMKR